MEIDRWVSGYRVRAFPWVDGNTIYFNVSYYAPGQSLEQPPFWETTAYIADNEAGRRFIEEFTDTLTNYVAGLDIPKGGHALLTFQQEGNHE